MLRHSGISSVSSYMDFHLVSGDGCAPSLWHFECIFLYGLSPSAWRWPCSVTVVFRVYLLTWTFTWWLGMAVLCHSGIFRVSFYIVWTFILCLGMAVLRHCGLSSVTSYTNFHLVPGDGCASSLWHFECIF